MPKKTDQMERIKEYYAEFMRHPTPSSRKLAGIPASKSEFARFHHIDRTTLWHWEQDDEFMRKVYNDNLGAVTVDEVARIIDALKKKAFQGNVQAAKLLLEWTGLYGKNAIGQKKPEELSHEDVETLTDEELHELVGASEEEPHDSKFDSGAGTRMAGML